MKKNHKNCDCDECFRYAVTEAVDRGIKEKIRYNFGVVCPFCGTNPSEKAAHGSGFKDSCGHEVRENGLVIGWKKPNGRVIFECKNPEQTRQLIYVKGKWTEEDE